MDAFFAHSRISVAAGYPLDDTPVAATVVADVDGDPDRRYTPLAG
jgi:hypothetical protein